MKYFKVKSNLVTVETFKLNKSRQQIPYKNFIPEELITETELKKFEKYSPYSVRFEDKKGTHFFRYNRKLIFDEIYLSQKKVCFFFGARFEIKE